ncbi:MAG: fatty acid desaturase [Tildeniella nuda ZEHNDER 1965/U140]|jgi:fatty acid desaturase|nr:fatty acid desaturase [Tildeniella nuda ZEHNDER 1965/U140]
MTVPTDQALTHQSVYAKKLRPLLPPEAFFPDASKAVILCINLAILVLGWAIADKLDRWDIRLLWLYLPLALIMGNSVAVLAFSCHDLMHGTVARNHRLIGVLSLLGQTILWMPPTLWKLLHNRVHHNTTNSLSDPDRNYLHTQPKTWGKWLQNLCFPSFEVHPIGLVVGMAAAWGFYAFRNLTSVLLFNRETVDYLPAAFKVKAKERLAIAGEFLVILVLHLGILSYLQFSLVKIVMSYLLPIWVGYSIMIFYIYTQHLVCPLTAVNDPLVNSVSLRVPKIVDRLHLNFSYHAEHHIFPSINSDYYPAVRELLQIYYPDRMHYILDAREAWRFLLATPRHYQDETTLTNWSGKASIACLLNLPTL